MNTIHFDANGYLRWPPKTTIGEIQQWILFDDIYTAYWRYRNDI